jgi:5'-deoxynucleotidase YfbR-like HD superfamily hydrolase
VRDLAALLAEVGDLKRVRVAGDERSLATRAFLRAWGALAAGADVREVALAETAAAVVATRLSGIDAAVLRDHGIDPAPAVAAALRDAGPLAAPLDGAPEPRAGGEPPAFALALADQPRAGATAPGAPRLVLHPVETHGDHCLVVAVGAVLLALRDGADPSDAFLAGLSHHLHNASVPDAGFAGEVLLGGALEPLFDAARRRALADLAEPLRSRAAEAARLALHVETPEARAVVAADVLDRMLEMRHHARVAAFTYEVALDELELNHEGPLQAFGDEVLEAAGLRG